MRLVLPRGRPIPHLWRGLIGPALVATAIGCMVQDVVPTAGQAALTPHLVAFYDFEHPAAGDPSIEQDRGASGTPIELINGRGAMRVRDGAHPASRFSLQTQQIDAAGNDDWKAGVYDASGVASLARFGDAVGVTLMGWVKPTGPNPGLNTNTPEPDDRYGAIGLFGLLSGDSDGHAVRALVEVIDVSGTLRLVALGRRVDGGASRVLAASEDWQTLLPGNTWTHLTATFDFDRGTMALYRNGLSLEAFYTTDGDEWALDGPPEPDRTSSEAPAGIKIGGSYPQNSSERNAFTGRFDDLMFFDRALDATEVARQFQRVLSRR